MKQGASVAVDACDLVHASFPVTADVGNQVVVILLIHCACCSDDVRSERNLQLLQFLVIHLTTLSGVKYYLSSQHSA